MKATRQFLLLTLAACSATQGGRPYSGGGSGSGVEVMPELDPPANTIYGSIFDERGDAIDFSTGEPVHSHKGNSIALGGDDCPAIYKYAYLTDKGARTYGQELVRNPIAFHVRSPDATNAEYRVRTDDGRTLTDWTSIEPGDEYTVELHRDDNAAMAAMGTEIRKMYIDMRMSTEGASTVATACWENHPLAAPLQISPAASAALFGLSIPSGSTISPLLNDGWGIDVATLPIVQMTNEAMAIDVAMPAPTGTASETGADTYILDSVVTETVGANCDIAPGCSAPVTAPTQITANTGSLGAIVLLRIVDDATNATICTQSDSDVLAVTCALPPRGNGPAHGYHAILSLAQTATLMPFGFSPYSEYTVGAKRYTGLAPEAVSGCTHTGIRVIHGTSYTVCTEITTYQHVKLLDSASIAFDPITPTVTSTIGESAMPALPVLTMPATTWNAGNAGF